MIPPPVFLLVALMIGYPLVQILAIGLRRRKRLRFNAISDEFLADRTLGHFDRTVVRRLKTSSRGGAWTFKVLLALPVTAFLSAFEVDASDTRTQPKGAAPETIEWLRDQSIDLEMATHPIGTAIAVPIAFLAWGLGAIVVVLKGAAKPPFPSIHSVVKAATHAATAPLANRLS